MPSCLKAIFESLAPGNPYVVCLYCAPIRQSATSAVRGGDFNNRLREGRKTRRADADTTHCCSPDAGIGSCPRPAFLPPARMANDGGITPPTKPCFSLACCETDT